MSSVAARVLLGHLEPGVRTVAFGMGGLLAAASVAVVAVTARSAATSKSARELRARTWTWWLLLSIFYVALLFDARGLAALLCMASVLALHEYIGLLGPAMAPALPLHIALVAASVGAYLTLALNYYKMYVVLLPLHFFLFVPWYVARFHYTTTTDTGGAGGGRSNRSQVIARCAAYHLAIMTTVQGLSHVVCMLNYNRPGGSSLLFDGAVGDGIGLVIYVLSVTELNDVAQFVTGKTFGTPEWRLWPNVSPNKSAQGVVGGVCCSALLSVLLTPLLAPTSLGQSKIESAVVGGLLGVAGFYGDLSVSALKRDLKIKDSGKLLPGHGGLLDRVDSLTYTAPLLWLYLCQFHDALHPSTYHMYATGDRTTAHSRREAFYVAFGVALLAFVLYVFTRNVRIARRMLLHVRLRAFAVLKQVILLTVVLKMGRWYATAYLCYFSFCMMKEYVASLQFRPKDRMLLLYAFVAVVLQQVLVHRGHLGVALSLIPSMLLLVLPVRMVVSGNIVHYLRTIATLHWGALLSGFAVSHFGMIGLYYDKYNIYSGPQMLMYLYAICTTIAHVLALLTAGDIQLLRRKSSTMVCVAVGIAVAAALHPLHLTPFTFVESLLVGAALGAAACGGELVTCVLKRELSVEPTDDDLDDVAASLAGAHVLDASNTFLWTAPAFFHYFYFMTPARRAFVFGVE